MQCFNRTQFASKYIISIIFGKNTKDLLNTLQFFNTQKINELGD